MNDAEIDQAKDVLNNYMKTFSSMISLRAQSKAATEEFYSSRNDTIDLLRRLSHRIKASGNYDSAVGQDFGIVNRYSPITYFSESKPVLKAKLNGSQVIIKYAGYSADGIVLFSSRGNEKDFIEVAKVFRRTYTDDRPNLSKSNPEVRKYYATYFVKDRECGLRSDVIKVIVP